MSVEPGYRKKQEFDVLAKKCVRRISSVVSAPVMYDFYLKGFVRTRL